MKSHDPSSTPKLLYVPNQRSIQMTRNRHKMHKLHSIQGVRLTVHSTPFPRPCNTKAMKNSKQFKMQDASIIKKTKETTKPLPQICAKIASKSSSLRATTNTSIHLKHNTIRQRRSPRHQPRCTHQSRKQPNKGILHISLHDSHICSSLEEGQQRSFHTHYNVGTQNPPQSGNCRSV